MWGPPPTSKPWWMCLPYTTSNLQHSVAFQSQPFILLGGPQGEGDAQQVFPQLLSHLFFAPKPVTVKSPTALFFYSHPFLVEHFFFPVPTACPLWTDLTPKSCPRQKLLALTNWQSPTICPFNPVSWGNICKSTVNEPFHCVLRFEKVVSSSLEFFNLKF